MTTDELITALNGLIETSKDGEQGFQSCSDNAHDAYLKSVLATRARGCSDAARELQNLVRSLNGKPTDHSSLSGTLHRRWIDIKSAILGQSDEAILEECERGEDFALRSYRHALDKDLPQDVRSVVERQYEGVLQNHDMVKTLRDKLHAHS